MKYVYKAMANTQNHAALLKWHGALTDKVCGVHCRLLTIALRIWSQCGVGIIMRALVDRKI